MSGSGDEVDQASITFSVSELEEHGTGQLFLGLSGLPYNMTEGSDSSRNSDSVGERRRDGSGSPNTDGNGNDHGIVDVVLGSDHEGLSEASSESPTKVERNKCSVPQGSSSKPQKSKIAKKKPCVYETDTKKRGQIAQRSGASLKAAAAAYNIKTGAKIVLKSQYVGPNGRPISFKFGTNFKMMGDVSPAKIPSIQMIETCVAKVVEEKIAKVLPSTQSTTDTEKPMCSKSLYFTPKLRTRHARDSKHCILCNRGHFTKDAIIYESAWIHCAGHGDKPCGKRVHTHCLGFPGLYDEDAEALPSFYCSEHLAFGAAEKKVRFRYEGQPSPKKTRKRHLGTKK